MFSITRTGRIAGITLGQVIPGIFHVLGEATVAQVNIPVAVLVWLMIVPMLLKIDLKALRQVGQHWLRVGTSNPAPARASF